MVTQEQIIKGITSYYEIEICQKASGVQQFAAYFMMPSIPVKVKKLLEENKKSPMLDDVINADGLINLDEIRDRAANAMSHCGRIELYGLYLNNDDINMIYNYIMRS